MFSSVTNHVIQQELLQKYGWLTPDQIIPFPTNDHPLLRAIEGEICKDIEMLVYHPQTAVGIWITVNSRPIKDGEGKLIGGLIICSDITERKQIEATLHEQQAQYRSIFEAVSDGIFIDDLETGKLVEVNPATSRILGYSAEELKQLPPTVYVHPDYLHLFEKYIDWQSH